jgi:hypothetical protein
MFLHHTAEHTRSEVLRDPDTRVLAARTCAETAAGHGQRSSHSGNGQPDRQGRTDRHQICPQDVPRPAFSPTWCAFDNAPILAKTGRAADLAMLI